MRGNPYALPTHSRDPSPLSWETFRHRARPGDNQEDLAGLLRHAVEDDLELDTEYEGLSLLAAALSGWGHLAPLESPKTPILLPVPGQPASAVMGPGIAWPEAIAGVLIHRGADPFVKWGRLLSAQECPDLGEGRPTVSRCLCPVSLAMEGGLDNTLSQMLRHPQSPAPKEWDTLRIGPLPWMHVAASSRPGLLAPLLAHGLDPNVRDSYGRTPLFLATDVNQVAQLVAAGADVSLVNDRGRTADIFWREQGTKRAAEMVAYLFPKKVTSTLSAGPRQVFDDVFLGKRGSLPKPPNPFPEPISVTGFQQPLSLLGHALLGILVDTIRHPEPLLVALLAGSPMGSTEKSLLSIVAATNPVRKPLRGHESKRSVDLRLHDNAWKELVEEKAAANPANAEELHAIVPQAINFIAARFPDLKKAADVAGDLALRMGKWEETSPLLSVLWYWTAIVDQKATLGGIKLPPWDPWGEGWLRRSHPESLRHTDPETVIHMLNACLRHLEEGSGPKTSTIPLRKKLETELASWGRLQWENLDHSGVAEAFEDRMQRSKIGVPWLSAWQASRRQASALGAGDPTSKARPRPRP